MHHDDSVRGVYSSRIVPCAQLSRWLRAAVFLTAARVVSACSGDPIDLSQPPIDNTPVARPTLPPTYRSSGRAESGDVFVHLFEWKWTDIASECTQVLGPAGMAAVQVSPPQEHLVLPTAPWWQRYQPVSYSIERSRSGTRAEFVAMIDACKRVGVGIYVDAVINHMTAGAGTGSSGTAYTKYVYPGLYTAADFRPSCSILSYQSAQQVQDCELLGLADLRTDSPSVQEKIADYLIALHRLGVAGFRIDAAKHIQPVELDAILARVNRAATAEGRTVPYVFGEVIDYGGEAVRVSDYLGMGFASGGVGDITEFKYRGIGNKFLNANGEKVADLSRFTPTLWGLLPSDKAVVFVENHDTQRSDGVSYREPELLRLSYVWLLGHPYGYPSIMSSYAFERSTTSGRDRGPPSDGGGNTTTVACVSRIEQATLNSWVCEHRDLVVLRMVGFRKAMAGTDANRMWDNGANAVAFSRGDRGFVAINRDATPLSALIPTALSPGRYCDGLSGVRTGTTCTGLEVVVDAQGRAQVELPARQALVLDRATRQ